MVQEKVYTEIDDILDILFTSRINKLECEVQINDSDHEIHLGDDDLENFHLLQYN